MANAETSELNLVLKFKKLVEAGKGGAIVKNDRIVDSLGNIYIHATVLVEHFIWSNLVTPCHL